MKLWQIRQVLSQRGWKLTKSLGQNFLHDENQLRRIMQAAQAGPRDNVLEIGPGLGALTERLAGQVGRLLAIEKDRRLFDFLSERFAGAPNIELVHADALEYVRNNRQWGGWKLVSNLPYSVASPILVELAQAQEPPERMTATLQIDVARRIEAQAGSQSYGALSLLMQLAYECQDCFRIPAGCFFPVPAVDSACLTLLLRPAPLLSQARLRELFSKIVKRAFSQRRKMMFKLLKEDWPMEKLSAFFAQAGLPENIRAEEVSLRQFTLLARLLGEGRGKQYD